MMSFYDFSVRPTFCLTSNENLWQRKQSFRVTDYAVSQVLKETLEWLSTEGHISSSCRESVLNHSANSLQTFSETRQYARAVNRDTSMMARAQNSWQINSERLGSRDRKMSGS